VRRRRRCGSKTIWVRGHLRFEIVVLRSGSLVHLPGDTNCAAISTRSLYTCPSLTPPRPVLESREGKESLDEVLAHRLHSPKPNPSILSCTSTLSDPVLSTTTSPCWTVSSPCFIRAAPMPGPDDDRRNLRCPSDPRNNKAEKVWERAVYR
jgi:hypothetical protein